VINAYRDGIMTGDLTPEQALAAYREQKPPHDNRAKPSTRRAARTPELKRTGEKGRGPDPWAWFQTAGVEVAWLTHLEQHLIRMVYQVHTMRAGWHKNDRRDRDTRKGVALRPAIVREHLSTLRRQEYSTGAIRDAARNLTRWGFHVVVEDGGRYDAPIVASGWFKKSPRKTVAALRECYAKLRQDRRRRPLPPRWIEDKASSTASDGRRKVAARSAHRRRNATVTPPEGHRRATVGGGVTVRMKQTPSGQSVDSREMRVSPGSIESLVPRVEAGGQILEAEGQRTDAAPTTDGADPEQLWQGIRQIARRRSPDGSQPPEEA
jgi:hypothetical protein